jgi:putative ABC transport system permease protein
MVRLPAGVPVLDRKLLRDLWEMKGQSLAIAAVIGAGVAMFVTYLSNFDSLRRTRDLYYQGARFADVFASVKRAPASLELRIAALQGVEVAATRVVADVTLDVPGLQEPATGRLISLPERGRPPLNDVFLRRGRWVDAERPDEVIANEAFVDANGLQPGNRVAAVINGRRRSLTIVGVALSPEYVYGIRPGEIFPDKQRFGIFWMGRQALASAFDMEGGFNDVTLKLARDASSPEVIAALDHLTAPYGGRGAVPQSLQPSAWTLDNELRQLQTFGFLVPLIFFGVAAFILNVALARALALQRPQIAALKALGYSNRELGWHYLKWAMVIAVLGGLVGVGIGSWLGSGMIRLYNQFFKFPNLDYHLSIGVALASVAASLVAAAAGAQSAVRRAVRIAPAEAMRPEVPPRYRVSVFERLRGRSRTTMATRMILRNLERSPVRSVVSILGIAFAVAVLFVGLAFMDVMKLLINEQFDLSMRQDATVIFVEPRSVRATYEVERLPGVMDVEPQRSTPARLRHGSRSRTLAIAGVPAAPRLNRIIDRAGGPVRLPGDGLVLSKMLGDLLGVAPGQTLQLEVLEGERPVRDVQVAALVDDSMGLQAYMRIDVLRRMLREGEVVTGAALTLDPAQTDRFYREVKLIPAVAGVALRAVALQNFRDTMAESMNISIMFNVGFAAIIAFGVVYNAARVSLSERSRELASLRVLGFTRAEISLILLGELAILTICALPVGAAIGYGLGELIISGFNNEVYRLSFVVSRSTVAWSFLIVIAAALVSGLVVRRRLDRLDLVAVLKIRE